MKKSFTLTGKDGTHSGYVEVQLNSIKIRIKTHNHNTHEDTETTLLRHSVIAVINDDIIAEFDVILESDIPEFVSKAETRLISKLEFLACNLRSNTINELLKERGYE